MIAVSLIAVALAAPCPSLCPAAAAPGTPRGGPALARARANRPLARYKSGDDYPAAALRNREQGRVGFALGIGADGRVNACRITASSGSAALDSTTCRIMRSRARYTPARDSRGVAVFDVDVGELSWTLPAD